MDRDVFAQVEAYIEELFLPAEPELEAALRDTEAAGMPAIQISPGQGKLLYLLAKMRGARRVLELGALGGYSTIWLGRALPEDGRLVSLELLEAHAMVARKNLERAGLGNKVEVVVGRAADTMRAMVDRGEEPFDLVFIDADKTNYIEYLRFALELTRPGSVILADNVIRKGAVLDPDTEEEIVKGVQAFNKALAAEPRVEALVVQQVGGKAHDGLAIALVK